MILYPRGFSRSKLDKLEEVYFNSHDDCSFIDLQMMPNLHYLEDEGVPKNREGMPGFDYKYTLKEFAGFTHIGNGRYRRSETPRLESMQERKQS